MLVASDRHRFTVTNHYSILILYKLTIFVHQQQI